MSAESLALKQAELTCTGLGTHIQGAGSLPTSGARVTERSPVLLGATSEMFPRRRSEWFSNRTCSEPFWSRSCSDPGEHKPAAGDDQGWVHLNGSPVRHQALKPSSDDCPKVERQSDIQEFAKAVKGADLTEERHGSQVSTQSTAVCGTRQGGSADLVPAFRSWDSACSTVATVGDLGRDDACEGQKVQWDGGASLTQPDPAPCLGHSPDFPPGMGFSDGFKLGKVLGEGGFGVVHKCMARKSGHEYAVKLVEQEGLHPLDRQALETEVRLHLSLPVHDHIVSLHASFEEVGVMKLVMEMCTGGDLSAHIDELKQRHRWKGGNYALSEPAAAAVERQLLSALAFCHGHGVVHRDVKPGNVLLSAPAKQLPLESASAAVKLCDFGYAAGCGSGAPPSLRDFVGSPEYLAPEVARREAHGCAVDVWSAGVVLFECLSGQVPFDAGTDKEIVRLVRKAEYSFDEGWSKISGEAMSCVQRLLVDVQLRPTAVEALDHPWLSK